MRRRSGSVMPRSTASTVEDVRTRTVVALVASAVVLTVTAGGVVAITRSVDAANTAQQALDPFYAASSPLPSGMPGDIIRSEPLTPDPGLTNARSYRVLYRTEMPDGSPAGERGDAVRAHRTGASRWPQGDRVGPPHRGHGRLVRTLAKHPAHPEHGLAAGHAGPRLDRHRHRLRRAGHRRDRVLPDRRERGHRHDQLRAHGPPVPRRRRLQRLRRLRALPGRARSAVGRRPRPDIRTRAGPGRGGRGSTRRRTRVAGEPAVGRHRLLGHRSGGVHVVPRRVPRPRPRPGGLAGCASSGTSPSPMAACSRR